MQFLIVILVTPCDAILTRISAFGHLMPCTPITHLPVTEERPLESTAGAFHNKTFGVECYFRLFWMDSDHVGYCPLYGGDISAPCRLLCNLVVAASSLRCCISLDMSSRKDLRLTRAGCNLHLDLHPCCQVPRPLWRCHGCTAVSSSLVSSVAHPVVPT